MKYLLRTDVSCSEIDYEALWTEIQSDSHRNILCGVLYRHPNGNLTNFMAYLNATIEKFHWENMYCVIMGDFNLDVLKFETHPITNDFLDTLGSCFFQPQILQPTRITDHSSTLIDNIFFNSIDYFLIGGNIVYDLTNDLPNFLIINSYSFYQKISRSTSETLVSLMEQL